MNSRGKTVVMRHLKNLNRDSAIRITDQFPPEVHANRDKLWPMFVDAKRQGKQTRWNQDKLQIDGRTHKPPKDTNKDINLDTTEAAMKLKAKHTAVITKENSHFQAHTVNISSTDDVIPALKALCADTRIAGASHVMYAYRVGTQQHFVHNWEDDGEWGGGRWIMGAIQQHNVYNQLVCVTRWYGGRNMGKARFDTIKELANMAMEGL